MNDAYASLMEGIRTKCQQEGWFGPTCFGPSYRMHVPLENPSRQGFVFSPATEEQIHATENRLRVPLPPLLKTLYTTIANGGFGPGCGFYGVVDGYGSVETGYGIQTVIAGYEDRGYKDLFDTSAFAQYADTGNYRERISKLIPYSAWWRELLPICNLGCCQEICVDRQEHVFTVAPGEDETVYWLRQQPWTLEEWLWRWVKNEELLEQSPPRAA